MTAIRTILGVVALTLTVTMPARAETILLTSGAFNWAIGSGAATVTMSGGDFNFSGAASTFTGRFTPRMQCMVPECRAGSTVDLFARFSGADIGGTATYNGVTYSPVGSAAANASLDTRWSGSLQIPLTFTGGILTAPFTFTGEFYHSETPITFSTLDLLGVGTATLNFAPSLPFPGAFNLTAVRYEFDGAAPVPEPTSMLLIGSGLAGLAALRRRRSTRT
jgi:hypothetical protein